MHLAGQSPSNFQVRPQFFPNPASSSASTGMNYPEKHAYIVKFVDARRQVANWIQFHYCLLYFLWPFYSFLVLSGDRDVDQIDGGSKQNYYHSHYGNSHSLYSIISLNDSRCCAILTYRRSFSSMHPSNALLIYYTSTNQQFQSIIQINNSIPLCPFPNEGNNIQLIILQIIQKMSDTQNRNARIKSFEQKTINRSITDLLFYDKLADYLLECCNSQAKPNTLSFFSFLPLFVLSFVVRGPSTLAFVLTIIAILLHQLFDIANKKQAYRLSCFSLSTYYIDHLFDSLSSVFLVLTISSLLELDSSSTLTAVFFFGILPFYSHHLAMYNNEYFTFSIVSPTTEGLIITKLLFFIGIFSPSFFRAQILSGVTVGQVYIGGAALWLIIFVLLDIKSIVKGKRVTDFKSGLEEEYPLKNLFAVFMLGYSAMQMTSIQPELLSDSLYFYFAFGLIALIFSHTISNLILAYAYNEKYKQISLPFLIGMAVIVIYYFSCAFILGEEVQKIVSKIVMGVSLLCFLLYFVNDTWRNVKYISSVHGS